MIVITGASDGLGLQIAKIYQDTGIKVVNVSRRECKYADINIKCDLRKADDIKKAADEINTLDDELSGLINGAAVMSIQKLGEISEDELARVFETNVSSAILLVSRLSKKIIKDQADVLNIASTVGTKGYADQAAYGASKWAMRGFSANLQVEFKNYPNRVISLCVGGMRTKMSEKLGAPVTDPENWMNPEDIAKFIKQILDLPKLIEVSEIVINRKTS